MVFIKRYKNAGIPLAGAHLAIILAISPVLAQQASNPGFAAQGVALSNATPPAELTSSSSTRSDTGVPFESWMLYPSIFTGAVFNDNVYQTQSHRTAAVGARLTPSIEADRDDGVHKTTIYANADAQLYPGHNPNTGQTATTISGRGGIAHIWAPTSDVSIHFSGDFTRMDGAFGSTLATSAPLNSAMSFIGAPAAMNVAGYRQFTDQTTLTLSGEKKVTDKIFVRAGFGLQQLIYERPPIGAPSSLSGIDYNAFTRLGFTLTPQLNAFVETGADLQRYANSSPSNTNSYHLIGGVSSDLIGLFRGEVFGGVQKQFSTHGMFTALTSPTYGGNLFYYPTPYLTVAASINQGFGSAWGTLGAPGSASKTLQTRLQTDYSMSEFWRATARGGYAETRYSGSPLMTQSWITGGGVSYSFWRNLALTLDYQFTQTASNGFGVMPYTDNLVSAGATYRY